MIYQLFRAKITKISDKTCIIYTILQNLTIKVLVFPEIYTNFAPKESNFKLRNIIKNLMKMKKYLTMVLAIAISGVFVGCHEDELSGSLIDQKKTAFEEAFVKAFGQPDPTHNWGFRMRDSENFTRSENANANEWADPNKAYGGLLVPPPLTSEQIAVVKKYFQTVQYPTYEDPHWTNYFIQQVYKGGEDPMTGTDPKTGKPYSPEKYLAANNSTNIIGSAHMDHLAAINGTFVDHINNFNHGDCSPNYDVLDNGETVGGAHHTDKIMYMMNSTTKSFGYYNSNGSIRRTEYTGLVSYQTIINELGSEAECLNDGWDRSFMGFDFEQMVDNEMIISTFEFHGQIYNILSANTNMYCADRSEKTYSTIGGVANFNDRPSDDIIRDLLSKGYLPTNQNLKDWVKVGGCADGYYSDWIVTLTKAKTTVNIPDVIQITETPGGYYVTVQKVIESGRIMCEDLATSSLDDLDYNDVVYDAVIVDEYKMPCDKDGNLLGDEDDGYDHRYFATIRLMAAGGTIPVELVIPEENGDQNFDVHYELGAGDNVMINTLSEDERATVNGALVKATAPKTLINKKDGTDKFYGVELISDISLNVLYANVSTELVSNYGAATYKFLVPLGTKWAKERIRFDYGYPNYPKWVYDKDYNMDWYNDNVPDLLYDNLEGLDEDDFNTISTEPIFIGTGSEAASKNTVPATSLMEHPGSSEIKIYDYTQYAKPGYLCPEFDSEPKESLTVTVPDNYKNSIAVGQTIRIYGVSINGWYVTTNISGTEPFESYNDNGNYLEISVTSSNIDQIKSGITIEGKHFTVTYVTIVGLNTNTENQGTDEGGNGDTENQGEDSGNITYQGTEINGEFNFDNNNSIDITYDFRSAGTGSILRIYGYYYKPNPNQNTATTWTLNVQTSWSSDVTFSNITNAHNIDNSVAAIGNTEGCIELIFNESTGSQISNSDGRKLQIRGTNFKMTKLTFEKH